MMVNVSREKMLEIVAYLKEEGWANDEIAYFCGIEESEVRSM